MHLNECCVFVLLSVVTERKYDLWFCFMNLQLQSHIMYSKIFIAKLLIVIIYQANIRYPFLKIKSFYYNAGVVTATLQHPHL